MVCLNQISSFRRFSNECNRVDIYEELTSTNASERQQELTDSAESGQIAVDSESVIVQPIPFAFDMSASSLQVSAPRVVVSPEPEKVPDGPSSGTETDPEETDVMLGPLVPLGVGLGPGELEEGPKIGFCGGQLKTLSSWW